jgi:hypothetical protein
MFCGKCGTELSDDSAFCRKCGQPLSTVITTATGTTGTAAAVAPTPEREKTFLEKGGVAVTNTRFIVPGQTYAMAGVTSVRFERIEPKRVWPLLLTLVGLVCLGFPDTRGFGVLLLVVGILWLVLVKADFAVVLSSASGEVRAIKNKDSEFINSIVRALNDAIVYRR